MVVLEPGDIYCTRSSSWFGRAIRWATRDGGEAPTKINHVGCIVESGLLDQVIGVEALNRVERHAFWPHRVKRGDGVAVFRPQNVTTDDLRAIVQYCEAQVGKRYGYHKIALQALRKWGKARSVIDRVWGRVGWDRYPICSYLVARAYEQVGLDFGIKPNLATPDDIWDFCRDNPDKYDRILPLQQATAQ